MEFIFRSAQQAILAYTGGKMGISAVPGSGKTFTLSALAGEVIARGELADDQEVLIVTLVNSAVDNFAARVRSHLEAHGLLPVGYRVRTLHGLAHDIVRERPALLGLEEGFGIVDERLADGIRKDAAQAWLRSHPFDLDEYFDPDMEDSRRDWARREVLPDLVNSMAMAFIRTAKDMELTPTLLIQHLEALPAPLPLAEMGAAIYADYQQALEYRGAVDFDDLIRLALKALELDESLLSRLQYQWPYILEDEAQDSSRLQEKILRRLSGPHGNWVRVGDPNQAIYETFTTASPHFLIDFMHERGVQPRELPESGRSTRSIIKLANRLIRWSRSSHPTLGEDKTLFDPLIKPTRRGDPQPNPPDTPGSIRFIPNKFTPAEEVRQVANSVKHWLELHPDQTAAVLVPRNQRGFDLIANLEELGVEFLDILRSSSATRNAAGALGQVVEYLADPKSSSHLGDAYKSWRHVDQADRQAKARLTGFAETLRRCTHLEDYLWPSIENDWLESLALAEADYAELVDFRQVARRWHAAALLPIDQVILTIAQDLFSEPAELAIAHKLAVVLRQAAAEHPDWRLPELHRELEVISNNERRFLGFSDDDTGFNPNAHPGKVVVATIHKAKGLEWDRVYLMSVNNYDFPSFEADPFISEKWFLRGKLNLEAETLAQLEALQSQDQYNWYQEGEATRRAKLDYISERLRLLYVGITRARKELVLTWNTGRQGDMQPAVPFISLSEGEIGPIEE